MKYFTIKLKDKEFFIFFQNNQVYYSGQKPNYFKDNNIEPLVFFEKANKLLNKYGIKVPNNYSKQCFVDRSSEEVIYSFPYEFFTCIYCCIIMEEKFGKDTSKILRWELIKPNSRRNIIHACSIAAIALYFLNDGYNVIFPKEKQKDNNPDLLINDLRCEIKTIQRADWSREIDPETGFGEEHSRGADICFDIGTFIAKEKSGFKGILQGDVVFADLTEKSLGELIADAITFGRKKEMVYSLPEPKKYRVIFIIRHFTNCKGYFLDFQPKLWENINLASHISYIRSVFEYKIPADGKPHKVEFPPPPKFKVEKKKDL